MDAKFSQKELRQQPSGAEYVYVDGVFDLYVHEEDGKITGMDILDGNDERIQSALFASIKQRGSDPISPETGNRWAELLIGEVSVDSIITDIKTSVEKSAAGCSVVFGSDRDASGNEYLSYKIQVTA